MIIKSERIEMSSWMASDTMVDASGNRTQKAHREYVSNIGEVSFVGMQWLLVNSANVKFDRKQHLQTGLQTLRNKVLQQHHWASDAAEGTSASMTMAKEKQSMPRIKFIVGRTCSVFVATHMNFQKNIKS